MTSANDNDASAAGGEDARRLRLKRIYYRAAHRGTREMDVLVGGFAASRLETLDDAGLDAFEAILDVPDQQLYAVLAQGAAAPDAVAGPVLDAMIAYTQDRPRP